MKRNYAQTNKCLCEALAIIANEVVADLPSKKEIQRAMFMLEKAVVEFREVPNYDEEANCIEKIAHMLSSEEITIIDGLLSNNKGTIPAIKVLRTFLHHRFGGLKEYKTFIDTVVEETNITGESVTHVIERMAY